MMVPLYWQVASYLKKHVLFGIDRMKSTIKLKTSMRTVMMQQNSSQDIVIVPPCVLSCYTYRNA